MASDGNGRAAPTSASPRTPEVLGEAPATLPLEDLSGPEDDADPEHAPTARHLARLGRHASAGRARDGPAEMTSSSHTSEQSEQNGRRWPFGILDGAMRAVRHRGGNSGEW